MKSFATAATICVILVSSIQVIYHCFSISVVAEYEFGIASLVNKKELLQVGDPVQFQLHVGEDFAVNIQATREKLRSYVEAMKGGFM